MDTLKGTTTRLRKTFHYPDDTTDSQPEAIDEQEQDQLIQTLATQNSLRNAQFRRLLVALPLLAALPYVPALLRRRTAFLSLLALTSLASTAYLARAHPPGQTGIDLLDSWARPPTPPRYLSPDTASRWSSSSSPSPATAHRATRRSSTSLGLGLGTPFPHHSPLELYLPYLNLALCVALLLTGLLAVSGMSEADGDHLARLSLSCLPALVYAVVLAANVVMGGVDPERELGSLKYNYKGA